MELCEVAIDRDRGQIDRHSTTSLSYEKVHKPLALYLLYYDAPRVQVSEWEKEPAEPRQSDSQADVKWLASVSDQLSNQYAGKWVLVYKSGVVASSTKPGDLEQIAEQCGIRAPMIFRVAPLRSKQSARAIYAVQVFRTHDSVY